MTRRRDELRKRSHGDLLTAVENGDSSAEAVLREIQVRASRPIHARSCTAHITAGFYAICKDRVSYAG